MCQCIAHRVFSLSNESHCLRAVKPPKNEITQFCKLVARPLVDDVDLNAGCESSERPMKASRENHSAGTDTFHEIAQSPHIDDGARKSKLSLETHSNRLLSRVIRLHEHNLQMVVIRMNPESRDRGIHQSI